jgi:hypothetical protein
MSEEPTQGDTFERDGKFYVRDAQGQDVEMPEDAYRALKSYRGESDD